MHRLETLDKELAEQLRRATPERQQGAASLAARLAREATGLATPDGAGCAELERAVGRLDERAWDLQDAVESGGASEAHYLAAFRRARAASAARFARCAEPESAALDGVYEAANATESPDQLIAAVREYLAEA